MNKTSFTHKIFILEPTPKRIKLDYATKLTRLLRPQNIYNKQVTLRQT